MKIWRIRYHMDDTPSGACAEYFGTGSEARARCTALRIEYGVAKKETAVHLKGQGRNFMLLTLQPEHIEVPTNKAGLLRWLNVNATNQ